MSEISRRDLLRGRLFGAGRAAPDEQPPTPREESPPTEATAETSDETVDPVRSAPHARAAPPPPWDPAAQRPARGASPIAQVAPWELGPKEPAALTPPQNRRAETLGITRAAPGRRMTFSIQHNLCLAYRNVSCSVCRERCPEPGAIQVSEGRPSIDPEICTGCGDCVAVCPAPVMAVRMNAPSRGGAPR